MQGEAGISSSSLAIDPGRRETLLCHTENRRRVAGMKIDNGASRCQSKGSVIDKECVAAARACSTDKKVGDCAAVEHIHATAMTNVDTIESAARMNEPIICARRHARQQSVTGMRSAISTLPRLTRWSISKTLHGRRFRCHVAGYSDGPAPAAIETYH
jgi:hypothetical protein